jgi:hypothetical protein
VAYTFGCSTQPYAGLVICWYVNLIDVLRSEALFTNLISRLLPVCLALGVSFGSSDVFASSELPVEHEVERLMMQIDQKVDASDWSGVEAASDRILELGAEPPNRFYFYQGKLHLGRGELIKAKDSFVAYVVKAGQSGEFYREALEAMNRMESLESEPMVKQVDESLPTIGSAGEGYVKTLQALYLTEDAQAALLLHINGLLATNAYRGTKIITQEQRSGVVYQVAIDERNLLIQEKSFLESTPTLRIEKLSLPGVDPFWEYRCSKSEIQCWIYHPQKEYERWLLLGHDDLAVSELVTAFSHLVRLVQR